MEQNDEIVPCGFKARRWISVGLSLFVGFLLAIPVAASLLLCQRCGVSDYLIGQMYKNVDPPIDHEMPVTVTAYPASASTVAILGGRGEGLNCSIPWYARRLFPEFKLLENNSPVERRFHQACVFHDLCYRHGLATYGYSQADCDMILQEQAVRLCRYLRKSIDACQLDAKKVLAGVALFGAEAYRNWDQSTYFEFDPNPTKATDFTVNRVVNQPFHKAGWPDDPRQAILSFSIRNSGVNVGCINCARRTYSDDDLRDADVKFNGAIPIGSPNRHARAESRLAPFVSLPPRNFIAAPHLLNLPDGTQQFAWFNRSDAHNTLLCLTVAGPKQLLTHTHYKLPKCYRSASQRMSLGTSDLFSASPQPVVLMNQSGVGAYVTGLSAQRGRGARECSQKGTSLRIYKTTNILDGLEWLEAPADCLLDKQKVSIGEFAFFQYPPIIKDDRHIFLSRTMVSDPDGDSRKGDLRVTVFDVKLNNSSDNNAAIHDHNIDVSNAFDMMVPVTREKNDYRVLSLTVSSLPKSKNDEANLSLHEVDLLSGKLELLPMRSGTERKVLLHQSWARRPVQVIDAVDTDGTARTELVFSRSLMSRSAGNHGAVAFEFAIFGRDRFNAKVFSLQRSARCVVRYDGDLGGGHPACRRIHATEFRGRKGLQTRLHGTQLLIGNFRKLSDSSSSTMDIALFDACATRHPIILRASGATLQPAEDDGPSIARSVSCEGALSVERLAADVPDVSPQVPSNELKR